MNRYHNPTDEYNRVIYEVKLPYLGKNINNSMALKYVVPLACIGLSAVTAVTYVFYKRYFKAIPVKTDNSLEGTELQPYYKNIVSLGGKTKKVRKYKSKTRRA